MKIKLSFAFAFALLLPAAVMAQEANFSSISHKLAAANRTSQSAEWSVASEQASIKAEVAPQDPEVSFAYIWPHEADMLNRWELEVSQTLPDFRRRSAAGKVVKALDLQRQYEMQAINAENLYNAQSKLIELIGAKKDCELMHQIHENFDSLSVSYQKAWNRGEVSILDLNKIKIEHARADAANLEAAGRYAALVQEIVALSNGTVTPQELLTLTDYPTYINESALFGRLRSDNKTSQSCSTPGIGGNPADATSAPGCLPYAEDLSEGCYQDEELVELLAHSPQFLMLESKLNVARTKVDYASKARFPQFSVGYKHTYEDGIHFNDLLAGVTLPIWSRKQEKVAAQGELFATQADNNQQITELVASVKSDFVKAAMLKRQLDALGPIVEQTDNVRLLQVALDGGEISLLDYLQEIGYFADAINEYNAARQAYTQTVASIARYF